MAAPAGQPAGIGGSATVAAATRSSSRGGTVLVLSDASRRDFFFQPVRQCHRPLDRNRADEIILAIVAQ